MYICATQTSNRDRNVYSLQHKSGEVFKGTRMEFKEKFGHTFDTLVQPKNPNKSCKGWRLVNYLAIFLSVWYNRQMMW